MTTIKVLTINIRYDNPEDPFLWSDRKNRLVEKIKEYQPDIIATQEGRKPQLFDLRDRLSFAYQLADGHRDWHEIKMYPCLFYHSGDWDCLRSQDFWLSKTPDIPHSKDFGSAWPKLATLAHLTHKNSQKALDVASFHFDNVSGNARQEQSKVLTKVMQGFSQCQARILLGDANDHPGSETLQHIKGMNYREPWNYGSGPHTFHGFGDKATESRIDYILYHGSECELQHAMTDEPLPPHYSDHSIVLAEFMLK